MEAIKTLLERVPGSIFLEFDFLNDSFKIGPSSGTEIGLGHAGEFGSDKGFELIHPEDAERVRLFFETDLRHKAESEIQHRLLVNNEVRHFHSFFSTQFDDLGKPNKTYAVSRDITKEVELKEELERSNLLLESRNQSYREIVHDIKSPLANIEAISNLLDLENKANNADELSLLRAMKASAEQVNHMIQELNSLEHLAHDAELLGFETRQFPDYLQSIYPLLSVICERKSIQLHLAPSPSFQLIVQPSSFQRIFQNLVENAVKFSHPGTVVSITCAIDKEHALFQVQDQGIGIPPENIPILFNRKAKEKNRTGTAGELSTGLGLAIVKQAVNLHRGEIRVDSKLGTGTRFSLKFPLN